MRYFVELNSGEVKGPYEENILRDWLARGVMPRDTLTQEENEGIARPACEVFPGIAPSLQFTPEPESLPSAHTFHDEAMLETGSFTLGFFLATICSLPALCIIVWNSPNIGQKTYRGMWWGLAMPLFGLVTAVVMMATRAVVAGK